MAPHFLCDRIFITCEEIVKYLGSRWNAAWL